MGNDPCKCCCWAPGLDISSWILINPPSKILLPAPCQQALPQNIKPECTNFVSLSISFPFGLFLSHSTFLMGCFHFLVEIIVEKLGKEVRFGFFDEGIWVLENYPLENSLKGVLQKNPPQMCVFRQHSCKKSSWYPHPSGLLSPGGHGAQRNRPVHGSRVSLLNFTLGITLN